MLVSASKFWAGWVENWLGWVEFCIENIGGLVQERRNSIANALELPLSCTNLSMWETFIFGQVLQKCNFPHWSAIQGFLDNKW